SGFLRGFRIRGGDSNVLSSNESFNNQYGIDLAGATDAGLTTSNQLTGNDVHDNHDEGIHMGTGTVGAEISDNHFHANAYENVYLLNATQCVVQGNTVDTAGSTSFYIKHSPDNRFENNTVHDRPVHVRGNSSNNVFQTNVLDGVGYVFQAYEDTTLGWTYPHD